MKYVAEYYDEVNVSGVPDEMLLDIALIHIRKACLEAKASRETMMRIVEDIVEAAMDALDIMDPIP